MVVGLSEDGGDGPEQDYINGASLMAFVLLHFASARLPEEFKDKCRGDARHQQGWGWNVQVC